ncbi:MAG: hypothetical protein M5R36_20995 [Deltaproteobacteria bacterium]|nr:hypothetical protein [Deltaproteobacteria bacterium]
MIDLVFAVFAALKDLIHQLGYAGIVLGMTIESSAIPFPSEVVIPPAGALVHEGKMSMPLVILCGGVGSVIGGADQLLRGVFSGPSFLRALRKIRARHRRQDPAVRGIF